MRLASFSHPGYQHPEKSKGVRPHFFTDRVGVLSCCKNSNMPLVRGDVSLGIDGLRALRSGRPPLLPLPSSPALSLSSSSSLESGSGSPPILLGGGGGGW